MKGGSGSRESTHLQEEAVAKLHDVGFVYGGDLLPVVQESIAKGVLHSSPRLLLQRPTKGYMKH